MNQTVTLTVGLPGAGKTTYALNNRKANEVIISRDDIRLANYGVYYGPPIDENEVTRIQRQQIIAALENGCSIIVSDTNLSKSNVQKLVDLASQFQAEVIFKYFELPPATCIAYDEHRGSKTVGAKVINRMAKKAGINDKGWIPKHEYHYHKIKPYVDNPDLPPAVIVDIDGTIAKKSDRSPYDYSRVYEDTVIENVLDVVDSWAASESGGHVIFLSGRNSECRQQTIEWLLNKAEYDIESHSKVHLFMRAEDDPNTADYIVKDRLFEEHIAEKFNVKFLLDDRRQVVEMWRTKGLTVLDVAGNKF